MGRDCSEAAQLLYHYMDGELTAERRVLISHHLDDCPPCLDAFGFEVELRLVVSMRCRERVPEHLVKRVAEAIRELQERSVRE